MLKRLFSKIRQQQAGFTLVEITIVVVIGSVILATALSLLQPYFAQQQIERTASAVRTVDRALAEFLSDNGRYPCPASLITPRGDANDGVEICTTPPDNTNVFSAEGVRATGPVPGSVMVGAIPYKTLNIPVSVTIDAYSNRLTYAVSSDSVVTGFDDTLGPGDLTSAAAVMVIDESGSSIFRYDVDNNGTIENLPKHYFFFSHGENGMGAHTNDGILNASGCTPGTADFNNCDYQVAPFDGTFIAAARSLGNTVSYNDDVSNESLLIEEDLNDSLWGRTPSNDDNIYNLNSGNVGIGTDNPQANLHVEGRTAIGRIDGRPDYQNIAQDASNPATLMTFAEPGTPNAVQLFAENGTSAVINSVRSGSDGGDFIGLRGRGTYGSPAFADINDRIASFQGQGLLSNNTAPNNQGGGLYVLADEAWTASRMGSRIELRTTPSNSLVATPRLIINNNGQVLATNDVSSQTDIIAQGNMSAGGTVSSAGLIDVGVTNVACTSNISGAMRYQSNRIQYCDGATWKDFVPNCASGQFVSFNASGQPVCSNAPSPLPPNCVPGQFIRVGPGNQLECFSIPTCNPPQVLTLVNGNAVCTTFGQAANAVCGSTWACQVGISGAGTRDRQQWNCLNSTCYYCTWICEGANGGASATCGVSDNRGIGSSGGPCANW